MSDYAVLKGIPGCGQVIRGASGFPALVLTQTVAGSAYIKIGQQVVNIYSVTKSPVIEVHINGDHPELHNIVANVNRLMDVVEDKFEVVIVASYRRKL